MEATTALLLGLLIGIALGALGTWLVLRERIAAARRTASDRAALDAAAAQAVQASSGQLLELAGERFDRDSARREAVEQARRATQATEARAATKKFLGSGSAYTPQ